MSHCGCLVLQSDGGTGTTVGDLFLSPSPTSYFRERIQCLQMYVWPARELVHGGRNQAWLRDKETVSVWLCLSAMLGGRCAVAGGCLVGVCWRMTQTSSTAKL